MVPSSTGIGHVHKGFKTSVDNIWPELVDKLKEYGKTRTVWCTGHSLGAAMATLLAYRLQRTEDCPNPQALYTYGSPKVGNNKYVKQIESIGRRTLEKYIQVFETHKDSYKIEKELIDRLALLMNEEMFAVDLKYNMVKSIYNGNQSAFKLLMLNKTLINFLTK